MAKSIYQAEFRAAASCLYDLRIAARLSQIQLAELLDHPQSWISGGENGIKRLDLFQVYQWVVACGSSMARFGAMVDRKIAFERERDARAVTKKTRKAKR